MQKNLKITRDEKVICCDFCEEPLYYVGDDDDGEQYYFRFARHRHIHFGRDFKISCMDCVDGVDKKLQKLEKELINEDMQNLQRKTESGTTSRWSFLSRLWPIHK